METYRSGRTEPHSKCGCREIGTWVRIPPSPPKQNLNRTFKSLPYAFIVDKHLSNYYNEGGGIYMKLLIQETNWWGWHNSGKKVTDYEYDLENMKEGEKVIVSTTKVLNSDATAYLDEPNLYFILASKQKDKVELKIGSHMCFNKKNFTKEPLSFWIKEGQPLFLDSQSMDSGYTYSISIKD